MGLVGSDKAREGGAEGEASAVGVGPSIEEGASTVPVEGPNVSALLGGEPGVCVGTNVTVSLVVPVVVGESSATAVGSLVVPVVVGESSAVEVGDDEVNFVCMGDDGWGLASVVGEDDGAFVGDRVPLLTPGTSVTEFPIEVGTSNTRAGVGDKVKLNDTC